MMKQPWYVIDNETGAVLKGPMTERKAYNLQKKLNLEENRNTFAASESAAIRDGYLKNFIF